METVDIVFIGLIVLYVVIEIGFSIQRRKLKKREKQLLDELNKSK